MCNTESLESDLLIATLETVILYCLVACAHACHEKSVGIFAILHEANTSNSMFFSISVLFGLTRPINLFQSLPLRCLSHLQLQSVPAQVGSQTHACHFSFRELVYICRKRQKISLWLSICCLQSQRCFVLLQYACISGFFSFIFCVQLSVPGVILNAKHAENL